MRYNKYSIIFLIFPILLGLLFLCSSHKTAHRYYFSLSEMKVNTDKKTLELSCKLFTDDLEDALMKLNHSKVDLARSQDNKAVQKQVQDYLHERFKIVINGMASTTELIGFETENDVTWFYLEAKVTVVKTAPVKMKVMNSLLYDFLPEQTNVMHVIWNEKERTEKLVHPDKEVVFEF